MSLAIKSKLAQPGGWTHGSIIGDQKIKIPLILKDERDCLFAVPPWLPASSEFSDQSKTNYCPLFTDYCLLTTRPLWSR